MSEKRSDFAYFCRISTRWGDVDRMGHINNAKYFTYDEQARTGYLGKQIVDANLSANQCNFIVAKIGCDFLRQVTDPSEIDYGIRALKIGRSSIHLQGAAFIGDSCHSRSESVIVWFDYEAQKSRLVPQALRDSIMEFEILKPSKS